jgi:hypothetical protein
MCDKRADAFAAMRRSEKPAPTGAVDAGASMNDRKTGGSWLSRYAESVSNRKICGSWLASDSGVPGNVDVE